MSGPTTGPRREPGADMRTRTTIAGSAVALVGALGITAGLGLPGAPAAPPPPAPPVTTVPAPATIVPAAVSSGTARAATPATPAVATSHVTTLPAHRTTTTTTPASAGLPCGLTDGACVSISRKRAWLVRDGRVVLSAPITTGRPGERTSPGTFHVTW